MKIFLSYSRADKNHMQGIEKALYKPIQEQKITLWIDKNELYPTEKFDTTIANQIKKANMVLLLLGTDFWSSDYIQKKEFPLIMQEHRERGLLIFPIILRDIADFSRYRELEGIFAYPFDDEGNLTTIEDFEIRDRAYNKIAIKILDLLPKFYKNPYKHLSFFESKDSDNFYGREAISKELANTTLTLNAGLLFGESGVGKTSLILAGVLVELKRVDSFEAVYIRCRKDITKNLREILIQELGSEGVTLREILECYIAQQGSRVLLIFDQFEEIFITVSTREEKKFFQEILFEIKDIEGVHLLFSLRADYLWRLNPYRDEFGELWNRSVGLERLQKEDALRAIAKPLEEDRLDDSLALGIYHDLQNESKNEEVDTPFLQLVMFELYTKSIGRNSLKITKKLYDELGGVHGIITNYFDGLLSRFDADEHKSLEKLFFYLVTDSLTRDSLKKSDLKAIFSQKHERKRIYKLIKRLIEDRVVRHVTDIDEYYELVHDILALHISKQFNLRQNIKHLTNRLDYLDVEESSNRYLSEKELYEIIIYQELFDLKPKHHIQIVRNIIKYQLKLKEWIREHKGLFYQILDEFLESGDSSLSVLAFQSIVEYRELIDLDLRDRVYRIIGKKFKNLNNNDTETYWILTLLIKLEIEPSPDELAIVGAFALDYNANWDISQQAILLILKYDFDNEEFRENFDNDTVFDFVRKKEQFVKEVIYTYIQKMGVDGYLEYMLDKFDIYASDMFDDEDDDILIYQYVLIMAESLLEYLGENFYPVESSEYIEKIEDKLTELYIILAFKTTEDIEYEKLYERLENLLLDVGFEFNGTLLVDAFINQAHPSQLNTKVAFDLASAIPDESLDIIVARLNEEDDTLRQNAYALLRYRFDDVLEIDLEEYSDIGYDEINLFLNFDRDKRIFQELSLSYKDIQIKRLEDYFDPFLAYEQFIVWEKNLDNRLQQLNSTIDKSLKNIMVGSLDMIDKDFRTIKSSLDSFLSFFKIELMIEKLIKLNSTTLRHYKEEIEEAFKIYTDTQIKKQKKGVENLAKVINIYRELEKEVEVLFDKELLSNIRADIKFMSAYIEAKNIDIALDYWLDYITDVVYLLVKERTQESLELKEKLLEKMIKLNMYDNIKMLFRDITSKSNKLDLSLLEKSEDWHIQDILLESYYELKTDIPLYTIDRFLTIFHVTVRQFAFKLLMINSQIDNNIKRDRAFKYLDNNSLRIFALELLFEVGIKEDILRLIEYRVVQDLGFQEKLGWCVDGILGRSDIKVL